MTHSKIAVALGLAACLALAVAARTRQERLSLSGRVVMETKEQLPRFTARLYSPKGENRPTLVTYTDSGGNFKFADLRAGRYLLEVYLGSDMVFQKVIALDERLEQPLVITLRPRA